jgi:hypothetical protein
MSPAPEAAYRLDDLGWLQFDRLTNLVLEADAGLSDLAWLGGSDTGRVAYVGQDVVPPSRRTRLRGPVTVATIWVRQSNPESRMLEFAFRLASLPGELGDRLLVLTNLAPPRSGGRRGR